MDFRMRNKLFYTCSVWFCEELMGKLRRATHQISSKILLVSSIVFLILSHCCLCMAMDDLTPQEWASVAESARQDELARQQEERELREAERLSLDSLAEEHKRRECQEKTEIERRKELERHEIAIKEAEKTDSKPSLPRLSDSQMEAGLGSALYSVSQEDFGKLHDCGHIIDARFLTNIFFKSIFQYYTDDLLGFDMTYNYAQFADTTLKLAGVDRFKFKFLGVMGLEFHIKDPALRSKCFAQVEMVRRAIESLMHNPLLNKLAVAYMRQKIVTEKLLCLVEKESAELLPLLLMHDRYAIDLQTMIYYFMKEAYERYINDVRHAHQQQEKIPDGRFLENFLPAFKEKPYYDRILAKLDELIQPSPCTTP